MADAPYAFGHTDCFTLATEAIGCQANVTSEVVRAALGVRPYQTSFGAVRSFLIAGRHFDEGFRDLLGMFDVPWNETRAGDIRVTRGARFDTTAIVLAGRLVLVPVDGQRVVLVPASCPPGSVLLRLL